METKEWMQALRDPHAKTAYRALLELEQRSMESDEVYGYADTLIEMMNDTEHSYVRTRGIRLLAANARWDKEQKIDRVMDQLLKHIEDEKPITSRVCIQCLPLIAKYKPYLIASMMQALVTYHVLYNSSMQKLIDQDRKKVMRILRQYEAEN